MAKEQLPLSLQPVSVSRIGDPTFLVLIRDLIPSPALMLLSTAPARLLSLCIEGLNLLYPSLLPRNNIKSRHHIITLPTKPASPIIDFMRCTQYAVRREKYQAILPTYLPTYLSLYSITVHLLRCAHCTYSALRASRRTSAHQ